MEESGTENESAKEKVKRPEFIILDDTQEFIRGGHQQYRIPEEELLTQEPSRSPLAIRILCLVGLFFSVLVAAGLLVGAIVSVLVATVCLFMNHTANDRVVRFWTLFRHAVVIIVGLLIALFSPTLGFGLLILYFSMKGTSRDREVLKRALKKVL